MCEDYPDCTLEYPADGTVIILPPNDPERRAGRFGSGVGVRGGSGMADCLGDTAWRPTNDPETPL